MSVMDENELNIDCSNEGSMLVFGQKGNEWKKETEEELIVRIAKGGFENAFGITFEKFQSSYKEMLENKPEKLI